MPGWVCRATVTPGSISASTMMVTYPGVGPSVCDSTFRVTPGVVAGAVVCADASVAMKPVTAQSAQDAIPAKSRRVSMTNLPVVSGSMASGLSEPAFGRAGVVQNCPTEVTLQAGNTLRVQCEAAFFRARRSMLARLASLRCGGGPANGISRRPSQRREGEQGPGFVGAERKRRSSRPGDGHRPRRWRPTHPAAGAGTGSGQARSPAPP